MPDVSYTNLRVFQDSIKLAVSCFVLLLFNNWWFQLPGGYAKWDPAIKRNLQVLKFWLGESLEDSFWMASAKWSHFEYFLIVHLLKYLYLFIWLCQVLVAARGIFVVEARELLNCGMWESSSLTRDWTWALCTGSGRSQPPDHQEVPCIFFNS